MFVSSRDWMAEDLVGKLSLNDVLSCQRPYILDMSLQVCGSMKQQGRPSQL